MRAKPGSSKERFSLVEGEGLAAKVVRGDFGGGAKVPAVWERGAGHARI